MQSRQRSISMVLCLVVASLIAFAVIQTVPATHAFQPQQFAMEQSLPCYVQITGSYSEIKVKRFLRITDRETWKALWEEHQGKDIEKNMTGWPVIPEIDFDSCMVIALLGGVGSQCNGYGVSALDDMGDHLRLRFGTHTFQIAIGADEELDESIYRGTPYGFFVVPDSKKMIILERDARSLIRSDPDWKEAFRFPAR